MLFRKNTLATKLILYNLIFSSFLTLILTTVQIYFDYKAELNESKTQFSLIKNGFINGLSSAIWFFDEKQIQNHMDGIFNIADVAELQLYINDSKKKTSNSEYSANGPKSSFVLTYVHEGKEKKLGTLWVTLTLDKVFYKLEKKFIIVLFSNAIKTFLVSYFIFILFYRLISNPLEIIAENAKKLSNDQFHLLSNEEKKLLKTAKLPDNANELEELSAAFTQMQGNFKYSYESLKKNEARLLDIAEFTSELNFETDIDFNINYFKRNDSVDDTFLKEIEIGKNIFALSMDNDMHQVLLNQKEKLLNKEFLKSFIFKVVTPDQIKYYSLSLKPFYDYETNAFSGYRGVIVDITSRREFEQKIEEQKTQIRQIQKLDAIGELTAGIAHDFNNVLSVISGSLKNMSRLEIDHDGLSKYLIKAQNATERGTKLSKRLLAFSRRQESEEKECNLNETIDSIAEILNIALTSSTKLTQDYAKDLWSTKIDLSLFENVLINLCVNAKDAMEKSENPEMLIKTRNVVHQSKEMVLIELKDNGEGIPDNIKAKIFEPFFTTKATDKGTGLGLSMVFNFIKQYEGDIEIESELSKGTSFKLYLPRFKA